MRVGIYGGAFDPPHTSHVLAVAEVMATANVDLLWVVPCWKHAFGKEMTDFDTRVEMCRRAFSMFKFVTVPTFEKELKTQYTVDLLRFLRKVHPHYEFVLVIGEDERDALDRWKEPEVVRELAEIHVLGRAPDVVGDAASDPIKLPGISSTGIRTTLALIKPEHREKMVQGRVPYDVFRYIEEKGLYPTQER